MLYNYGGQGGGVMAKTLNVSITDVYNKIGEGHKHYELLRTQERDRKYTRNINWGIGSQARLDDEAVNYYAHRAIDKTTCYKRLRRAGVPAPEIIENPIGYPKPFLGRANGMCEGRGIRRYKAGAKNIKRHDFYVELLPNEIEYRVHICFGKVLLVSEKVLPEGFDRIARNHRFGVRQSPVAAENWPEGVVKTAVDGMQALELDFAALDIILSNGLYYLLDVNTAPGFGRPSTVIAYAKEFRSNLAIEGEGNLKLHTKWLSEFFTVEEDD